MCEVKRACESAELGLLMGNSLCINIINLRSLLWIMSPNNLTLCRKTGYEDEKSRKDRPQLF